ncbi:AAA family ATPase, partial [Candidatus Sumerlaeota bacterium]|nr:AAA family ATPase [Candidatus Sumerlaeota bacterium]
METIKRHFWIELVEKAWSARSIVWLSGVRRIGKTCLSQSLENIEYFDCELPRIRRMMEDPQGFLDTLRKRRVVLDEIHRLSHPSELLKIAADHYPDIRILATGSSTLGASHKFRDTLTGRKRDIW